MRLTFLVTSPRVAAGLLSWTAWQAISAAERVCASDVTMPLARAVSAAGHPVDVLPDPTGAGLLAAAAEGSLVWLASDEESDRLAASLAQEVVAAAQGGAAGGGVVEGGVVGPEVEVVHGSYDMPGARLLDLVTVMDRLRTECPWDREQTHRSLAKYLLEESYETLEAIETGDREHLREELGDLLLQVYFHARIASESTADTAFNIDDVAAGIVTKLVRRHPHVFAGLDVADAGEVEVNWEAIKAAEKGRVSVLDGIPWNLPALALADKVVGRASRRPAGQKSADLSALQPPEPGEPPALPAPVHGEPPALQPPVHGEPPALQPPDRIGEALLLLVEDARAEGVDPEQALRDAVRRLADRVRDAEQA